MQRLSCVIFLAACCLLASCNRQGPSPRDVANPEGDAKPTVPVQPFVAVAGPGTGVDPANDPSKAIDALVANLTQTSNQDQYDAALLKALGLLADKQYAAALSALETARSVHDSEQIQNQIGHVKLLLAQQDAADKTVQDIRTVLHEGRAEDAVKLSTAALEQFGGSDAAEDLAKLKRQADALTVVPADDRVARRNLYVQEAVAALKDNNLRNAAISYEQALQTGDDANLRRDLDDVRAKLTRYDDGRRRAADLRRDANNLENALAALQDARAAWDTPQVRAEMDECQMWLEKRRDRISVADFEVRGDVGLALAGRTVAEEMLPAFKSKFDLVERDQLRKVLDELRLEGSAVADNPDGRQAVGRLANVRYLVVGSLTPICGVTLNARLVDVRSGLIVQTARYSAPSLEALLRKLPLVAQMLTMSDDQKLALEQQLAQQPFPEVRLIRVAPVIPPPPVFVVSEPPPPPIITYTPRPPSFVGVVIEDFRRPPPPVVEVEFRREDPRRQRLVHLSLELGDNLFRRGQYREANRHFELALTLAEDRREIDVRIGRCKPFLPPPPPPPVVIVTAPPPFVRPRAIVFNFFVNCPPGLVPPAVGDWAADNFASYLTGSFEIVERGEVCWYMGRLGITMRDVMNDAVARRALAQALNVRFMVFSAIEETHSLNVTTQLVDADTGARTGNGSIHVQDHDEMKLRMQELANQIAAPKDQQAKIAKQGQDNEKALNDARKLQKAGDNARAAEVARTALQQDPHNVALQQLAQENDKLAQQAAAELARKKDAERRQAEVAAAQKRQAELTQQAEAARARAEQEAKTRTEAAKRDQEAKQQRAYDQLMTQGRDAVKRSDYTAAVQSFQSATALKPSDDGFKELAQAKAKQDQATHARAAEEQAKHDAELKRQHDAEVTRAAAERQKKDADDALKRKAQEDHDKTEVARLLGVAKDQLSKQQFDAARGNVQTARQIHPGPDIDNLMHLIQDQQDLAEAKKKSDVAHAEAEKKLAADQKQREMAAAEAKKKQDAYSATLKQAQDAVAAKQYDKAIAAYQEAGKLFKTDAVLSGQRQAEELRDREKALADGAKRKQEEDAKRDAQVKKLLADGQKALDAKQFDQAVAQFREAGKLAPGNVEVLTAVSKAEQARDQYAAANRAKLEEDKKAAFNKLLNDGKAALTAKHYDDAVKSFTDAVHAQPQDATAQDLLRQAEKGRNEAKQASDVAAAKKREDELRAEKVRQYVVVARKAIEAKDVAAATQAWTEANKLAPNDPAVVQVMQDLGIAKKAIGDGELAKKKKADYDLAMSAGQTALKQKNYQGAVNSFNEALRILPGDAAATAQLKDADKLMKDAVTAQEMETKRKQEEAKKLQADYQNGMTFGRATLQAKKYDDAIKAFNDVLRLMPGDKDATNLLKEAEKQKADAKAAMDADAKRKQEEAKKLQADYQNGMTFGRATLQAKKYDDAIKAFNDVLRLMPGDKDATNLLKEAEKQKADAKAATDAEAKRKQEEAKKQDDFNRFMDQGKTAAAAKRFEEAVRAYGDALKLMPGNEAATKAQKEAQAAFDAAKTPPPNNAAEYKKQMDSGAALEKQKKFTEALAAYREALKLMPGDAKAAGAVKWAEFEVHMTEGQRLIDAKKFPDAVKELEEAVKLFPDNADAKNLLKKAKDGK